MQWVYTCQIYNGLLTLEGTEQMTDSLIPVSLGSTLQNSLVYNNNLIAHKNFVGEFVGSRNIADLAYTLIINEIRREFLMVVLESGQSKAQAQLHRNAQIWLKNSAVTIKVVLSFKMFPKNIHSEFKAKLYVCRLSVSKLDVTRYACSFFPCYYFSYTLLTDPLISQKIFHGSAFSVTNLYMLTVKELFDSRPSKDMQRRTKLLLALEKHCHAAC